MTDQNNQPPAPQAAPGPVAQNADQKTVQPPTEEEMRAKMPVAKELTQYSAHEHKEVTAHGAIHLVGVIAAVLGVLTLAATSGFILMSMMR